MKFPKTIALLLFFLLFGSILPAAVLENKHFRKIDRFAMSQDLEHMTDAKMLALVISENYSRETDRLRAAYTWIVYHVDYDLKRIGNPVSYRGDSAVSSTMRSRKAICSGYADLFIRLCYYMDIKAYYISGYTKIDGEIQDIEHAWVAVRLSNGKWKFFDPTWDSGYFINGSWVKQRSYARFMVEPTEFIKTHLPFDPMWQLLYQPIKTAYFLGVKDAFADSLLFNYSDTIIRHQILPESRMCADVIRRMEWCGIGGEAAQRYYNTTRSHLEYAQEGERASAKAIWSYAFSKATLRLEDACSMYLQLEDLKVTYKERGVSLMQLCYSSSVLADHVRQCKDTFEKLLNEEYTEPDNVNGALEKTAKLASKVAVQQTEILQMEGKRISNPIP